MAAIQWRLTLKSFGEIADCALGGFGIEDQVDEFRQAEERAGLRRRK